VGTNEKPSRSRTEPKALTIGALSRAARIPVGTLRTWERRYGSPKPIRKPSGHRLYPASSVEHLRRVGRLLARGHRAGEVLGLSLRELEALLSIGDSQKQPAKDSPASAWGSEQLERSLETAQQAAADLDRESLVRELRANWIRMGPPRFLEEFAGPFLTEVGRAWEENALEIRHEHFASACVSDFLREVREPFDQQARGPRLAAAMLPGDTHEGGLLMASVIFAFRGYRVVYLGAGMPVEQIVAAATSGNIDIVAISASLAISRKLAERAIVQIRGLLPQRMPLWIGGAGAPEAIAGVERFENLEALDARLTA
jgi:DNA-binding transcriptional MerR regulator/methylmalonyl-CoA mutase cobalamin-binding subunit